MAHNICHFDYHCSNSQKKVERDLDNFVAHEDWQEGATGLPQPIIWIDRVFPNRDEALGYIKSNDRGWYDCLAVKYKKGRKIYWLVKIEYHT